MTKSSQISRQQFLKKLGIFSAAAAINPLTSNGAENILPETNEQKLLGNKTICAIPPAQSITSSLLIRRFGVGSVW